MYTSYITCVVFEIFTGFRFWLLPNRGYYIRGYIITGVILQPGLYYNRFIGSRSLNFCP